MQQAYELIENSGVVVISSVNGLALAGGFELALSCDIVIVDEEAELGDEHIRKNLLPSGGSSQRRSRHRPSIRVYFVGINLKGQSEGPNEATPAPLSAVVSPGVLGLILALSAQSHRVAVNRISRLSCCTPGSSAVMTIPS